MYHQNMNYYLFLLFDRLSKDTIVCSKQ